MVSISTEHHQHVYDQAHRLFPEAKVQWAMLTRHGSMLDIFPLPSREAVAEIKAGAGRVPPLDRPCVRGRFNSSRTRKK